jgi:hypothetical protein
LSKREQRLARIRASPRNVRFEDLRSVLVAHGFVGRLGARNHWVFGHDLLTYHVTVDPRRPLLQVYVRAALKALDEVLEKLEESGD